MALAAGVLTGNVLGFARVAVTAYLLGTHSRADSLAVAIGPVDTLNSVLFNGILFAFVPMLTGLSGGERTALFIKLNRCFAAALAAVSAALFLAASPLMRLLAPGLDAQYFPVAVNILRIALLATPAAGALAVHCALLYTDRRFGPSAFYQATINFVTVAAALGFWRWIGVYGFAIGFTAGTWIQFGVAWLAARKGLNAAAAPRCSVSVSGILLKPGFFVVYAAGIGLNIIFTRAWVTHLGPGMAAALDYCMRGVSVPLAILVTPISNSLLPEISRLRSLARIREAFRLVDRTLALTALAAVCATAFALTFRQPAIALLFQRGSFTTDSTRLVSTVFLSLGPALIGWSLMEIFSRSLFAMDHRWPQVIAASIPVLVNVMLTLRLNSPKPELIGLGASSGFLVGFVVLFVTAHASRRRWARPA